MQKVHHPQLIHAQDGQCASIRTGSWAGSWMTSHSSAAETNGFSGTGVSPLNGLTIVVTASTTLARIVLSLVMTGRIITSLLAPLFPLWLSRPMFPRDSLIQVATWNATAQRVWP